MNVLAVLIPFLCLIAASMAALTGGQEQRQFPAAAYGQNNFDEYLEEAPAKRAQTFVRFGKRAQTFVRFGRSMPARYAVDEE